MALTNSHLRVVTATVKDGRVSLNQVVLANADPTPAGVLMAGYDLNQGVSLWFRSQQDVEANAKPQHGEYSSYVSQFSVDDPPGWLGKPIFLAKEGFTDWPDIEALKTHATRVAIIDILNDAF